MNYSKAKENQGSAGFRSRVRLMFWHMFHGRLPSSGTLDPRLLSDHILDDIGVERPSRPWDDSVGFWRGP
jgi:hypothetical protein